MLTGTTLQAISFGPAVRYLKDSAGWVLAVLSKAVYIESDLGHLVGIVGEDAPDGPFVLRVEALHALVAGLQCREGSAFIATQHEIRFAGGPTISLLHARPWTPCLPPALGTIEQRALAIDTLCEYLLPNVHLESCSPLAEYLPAVFRGGRFPEMQGRVPSRAASVLNAFLDALVADDPKTGAAALQPLLGLGPGLTPSGDDLLAGLIACLRWHEQIRAFDSAIVNAIADAILSTAPACTNRISRHLLHCAREGLLYAPAIDLGARLLCGKDGEVAEPASRLLEIGNSSGADMAVGIALGCAATARPKVHSQRQAKPRTPLSSSLTLNA